MFWKCNIPIPGKKISSWIPCSVCALSLGRWEPRGHIQETACGALEINAWHQSDPEEGILHHPPFLCCSTVQPHHKSQMGLRKSSRMFPYAQCPKWWGKKAHWEKKKLKKKGGGAEKWENKSWEIGLNMWGLDTVGWCCHFSVSEHRSQLCLSFPETASCTVFHVPWDLTTCLLISRDVFWGKIIAFTGEISLCSLWIA